MPEHCEPIYFLLQRWYLSCWTGQDPWMLWIWTSLVRSIKPFWVQSLLHMMFLQISWTSTGALLELAGDNKAGKLWVHYIEYVNVIQMFLHAERNGDWDLHLCCSRDMIPLFNAAGHLAYAKSARLYAQDSMDFCMKGVELPEMIPVKLVPIT